MSIEAKILTLLVLALTLLEFLSVLIDRCAIVGEKWFKLCSRLQTSKKQLKGSPAPQATGQEQKAE
jgi:hypothetical protein